MTPIEILKKIVDTDNNARTVYNEAIGLRDGFDNYIAEHLEVISKGVFADVDAEIDAYDREESLSSDEVIREMDEKLAVNLKSAELLFEEKKDVVVEKIFKLAVNINA